MHFQANSIDFHLLVWTTSNMQEDNIVMENKLCYNLKPLELDKRSNSCIKVNIRELDKEFCTK